MLNNGDLQSMWAVARETHLTFNAVSERGGKGWAGRQAGRPERGRMCCEGGGEFLPCLP